jgi:CheY-like chemotaxis protein
MFLLRALARALPQATLAEADDGQQAVAMVRASWSGAMGPYTAICMDNEMPVMSGREATSTLRRMGYSGVIVGVTGSALAEDVAAFIQSGANSVVTKPVHVPTLLDEIMRHLGGGGGAAAVPPASLTTA